MCADPTCDEPAHHWFGLSYSSYLVLQRSVMQAMPVDWQRRLVALLDEVEATVDTRKTFPASYRVSALGPGGRFTKDPYRDYRRGPEVPLRRSTRRIG